MEFIKEILAAVGGAVGVVIIILVLAKNLIQKWFENIIDQATEKSLAKYTNSLQRRTTAYEILLQKELNFYEQSSEFISDLIVDIQDFQYHLTQNGETDFDKARNIALKIMESIPKFKRDHLLAHTYIPQKIDEMSATIIGDLQKSCKIMTDVMVSISNRQSDDSTYSLIDEVTDTTLFECAKINQFISERLVELSKE